MNRRVNLDFVLSRPPGPESDFVELEIDGRSVELGEWFTRDDGLTTLRIPVILPTAVTKK